MNRTLVYYLIFFLLTLNSCGDNRKKTELGILPEKKMTELLVETHLADAILFIENSRADEKHDKGLFYYPSILEKYGITKAQMDSSVSWYMRHPEAYSRIYDQVIKELEKRKPAEKPTEETE
ncbi:MAG: DUF4296 domain-containing protein [Bacteroidales bacterium]|jgi:hypothetical protein